MREGVKKSVLSVCLSVCPVKNFEIRTFTTLKNCCTPQWHGNLKKNNVCVPDRDQSSSLFCISSSFLFNVGIVSHFDTVNHLDIRWRPGMCWPQARVRVHQPPRSQDSEKLGGGLGTRLHTHLIQFRQWTARHESTIWQVERSYAGLMRSDSYFMRSVIHLMKPVRSWSANSCWQPSWGVAGWGTRVDLQLGSVKNLWSFILTTNFNIIAM